MEGSATAWEAANVPKIERSLSLAVESCILARPADTTTFIIARLLAQEASASPRGRPPASTYSPSSSVASDWSAVSWLVSENVADILARALTVDSADSSCELAAMRALGSSAALEDELLTRLVAAVRPLAACLAPRLRKLAAPGGTATSHELQAKFGQEARGMLEYGSLNVFFGGLEGLMGSPSPRVRMAMAEEHTQRGDAACVFTTSNYDLRTTSATEWAFVATPDAPPAAGWPREGCLIAEPRRPRSLADLEAAMEAGANEELRKLGEPEMSMDEVVGLRLYTGPLFVKYNGVLRGLNSAVPSLQRALVNLCCDAATADAFSEGTLTYMQCKGHVNLYTTTLHVINSGIVKTSKLTYACPVYRGVSGMALPDAFWTPNKHGVRGGIEGAFMSCSKDRKVAMQYAASGGQTIIFEIQQGMIDRGAEIAWLSQYPGEAEILFAPLTGLEVRSTRVDGSVLVVEVSLSVNMKSLTIEQV